MADVYLVPFTGDHVYKTYNWVQEPDLRGLFMMRGEPTWEDHIAYFEKVLADNTQHVFAVMVDNVHTGNCGLKNVSYARKQGELWIYIGEPLMRGKGIGRAAVKLLVDEGFGKYSLDMIYVHVADFNVSAIRMYEKIGFSKAEQEEDLPEWGERGCRIIRMELKKN